MVDVEATLDLRPAGQGDDLAATADYAAMYEQVRAVLKGPIGSCSKRWPRRSRGGS